MQIWKLKYCRKDKFLFRLWAWGLVKILKLKFGQYFAADVWLKLRSWILVKIMKLGLVKILCLSLVEMLRFWIWWLIETLKLKFDQNYCNLWYELNPRVFCAFGNVCSRQHLELSVTKTNRSKVGGGLFVRNLFFNRYVIQIKFNLTIFLPILAAFQRRRENGDTNVETA